MRPPSVLLRRTRGFLAIIVLATGLGGQSALADALYTVTNLGTGPISFTTASGNSISVNPDQFNNSYSQIAFGNSWNYSQLASVSNGQVSYAFSTTPDTANIPSGFPFPVNNASPTASGTQAIAGLLNSNGLAAVSAQWPSGTLTDGAAYSAQRNADGTWGPSTLLVSQTTPGDLVEIGVAGLNKASQILLATSFPNTTYDALVYNGNTHTLTDLQTIPNLSPTLFQPFSNRDR